MFLARASGSLSNPLGTFLWGSIWLFLGFFDVFWRSLQAVLASLVAFGEQLQSNTMVLSVSCGRG